MTTTEPTYLDLLRADLADYDARIERARALLSKDDGDYYRMVLAQLERGRSIVEAKIAKEAQTEQKAS